MLTALLLFSLILVSRSTFVPMNSSSLYLAVQGVKEKTFIISFKDEFIKEFNMKVEVKNKKCIKVSLDDCRALEYLLPDSDVNGFWTIKISDEYLKVWKDGVRVVKYDYMDPCYQKFWFARNIEQFSLENIPGTAHIANPTESECTYVYYPYLDSSCVRHTKKICSTRYATDYDCIYNGTVIIPVENPERYDSHRGEIECSECFSGRCIKKKDDNGEEIEDVCPRDPFTRCSGSYGLNPLISLLIVFIIHHLEI